MSDKKNKVKKRMFKSVVKQKSNESLSNKSFVEIFKVFNKLQERVKQKIGSKIIPRDKDSTFKNYEKLLSKIDKVKVINRYQLKKILLFQINHLLKIYFLQNQKNQKK